MNIFQVLKKAVMSEKSSKLREMQKQYVLAVDLRANKTEIRKAVEGVYGVKVVKIQTAITRGKVRRRGAHVSLSEKVKKAVVTLSDGDKLPIFEDQ